MPVTLASILNRHVALEWYEGVALAQALCAGVLRDAGDAGARVPEPKDIELTPDGDIELLAEGPEGQSAVFRVARLMETLVPADRTPVQLRLVVLTAASSSSPYATLNELSQALEYYERPNRREVLQALHARCAPFGESAAVEPEPSLPLAPPVVKPPRIRLWRTYRRALLATSVVGLLAGLAGLGWWAATQPAGTWLGDGRQQVQQAAQKTAKVVGETAATGIQKVKEQLGLAVPEAPPAVVEAARVTATTGRTPPRRRGPLPSKAVASPLLAASAPILPPSEPILPVAVESAPDAPPEVPLDPTLYEGDAPGVVPPVSIWPKLPTTPPPGVQIEDLPLLELVVSAAGEVESVKILVDDGSVRTAMLLSAVKAWHFAPAMKDGHPVRYRHKVRVIVP